MRKYLFVLALGFQIITSAQTPESIRIDSLKIDSLQSTLQSLHDTARINCLNSLAEAFINRDGYKIKRQADSAYPYAMMANREATKINYKQGLAYSLVNLCGIAFFNVIHNNNLSTGNNAPIDNSEWFAKWDEFMNQLFRLAQELNDNEIWAEAYYCQADLFGKKGNKNGFTDAFKKSLFYFEKTGNEFRQSEISTWLCMQYSDKGEYEVGFEYCKKSLELAKKITAQPNHIEMNDYMLQQSLMNMSGLYNAAGDYETALDYLRQSEQYRLTHKSSMTWSVEGEMAELFRKMGQSDSVLRYEKPMNINGPVNMWVAKNLGEKYLMKADYDSALLMFNKAIAGFRKNKNANTKAIKYSLIGAAKALEGKKNYKRAVPLIRESLSIALNDGDRIAVRDNFEILSDLFYRSGESDSAYLYQKKYAAIKDSILNRQFYWRLNNYKKEAEEQRKTSQINLLNKDNQLKEQKLKQQAFVKNGLIIGILLLFLLGVFVFRTYYLKRKKQEAENKNRQTELEMQALRAQMNPHFIFNCLSSINKYILKNEPDTASDYLTRFSRLIRMVLMNSQRSLITLEDELDMLTIYLDMERMRFKNAFNYNIIFANRVDADAIFIPPLLLQPFCENAIWHGLKPLADHEQTDHEPGRLDIILSMEDKVLNCSITDNGIGRKKATEIRSKSAEEKKSLGLKITAERLALLNQEKGISTSYEIIDLYDENAVPNGEARRGNAPGTKVNLKISCKENIEELV